MSTEFKLLPRLLIRRKEDDTVYMSLKNFAKITGYRVQNFDGPLEKIAKKLELLGEDPKKHIAKVPYDVVIGRGGVRTYTDLQLSILAAACLSQSMTGNLEEVLIFQAEIAALAAKGMAEITPIKEEDIVVERREDVSVDMFF